MIRRRTHACCAGLAIGLLLATLPSEAAPRRTRGKLIDARQKTGDGPAGGAAAEGASDRSDDAAPRSSPESSGLLRAPFYCHAPDEAKAGSDTTIHCGAVRRLRVDSVELFFRVSGGDRYQSATVERTPSGWFLAVIPGASLKPRFVQYYAVARNRSGEEVAQDGRADSPNVVMVVEPPKPPPPPAAIVESPQTEAAPPTVAGVASTTAPRPPAWFWVALGVGTGYGYHDAGPLEGRGDARVESGVGITGIGHLLPEVGYQLSDDLALSLAGRIQFTPRTDNDAASPGTAPQWGVTLLARGMYLFPGQRLRPFVVAMVGAGDGFRFRFRPQAGLTSSDTRRGGPLVFGPGGGLLYPLSPALALTGEVDLLGSGPDFGVIAQVNIGLRLRL